MTCIVAVVNDRGYYMAGDRAASEDNLILPLAHSKVWKSGPYLFGYAGNLDGEKIMYNFVPPTPKKRDLDKFMLTEFTQALKACYDENFVFAPDNKEAEFGMIIVVNGRIYEHDAAVMSMTRFNSDFVVIGTGAEYAYGSLYSTDVWKDGKKRARLAVEAAVKYSPSCLGPVDVVEVINQKDA